MNERPVNVSIDRVVLRNVDDTSVDDLAALVAERLRSDAPDSDVGPIPATGRAMVEGAADHVVRSVRRAIDS